VIVGIGVDVVDIARFEVTMQRTPAIAARLFTEQEQQLPMHSLAARFAAKEALAKALGAPAGMAWTDAEVVSGAGAPTLRLIGSVAAEAQRREVRRWHLSLAHDGGIATAIVIAEG
jgi:holo-[acyl-carrier protein] synthase